MEASGHTKETKTAEELAAMIREDLSKVDGCPERGVTVTVYGIPRRSMLTFSAADREHQIVSYPLGGLHHHYARV